MIPQTMMRSTYPPLTNQVPYLTAANAGGGDRFFFLPFLGGLALGGLLFNNRPCCGGGYYGGYGGGYYPQPYYPQPYPAPYYSPNMYQQTSSQNAYYGPYAPSQPVQNDSTVVESNKFYLS